MREVALVTARAWPELTPDDRLVLPELERRGARASIVVWDDPAVRWRRFERVVLRSIWDYHLRPAEFLEWLDRLGDDGIPLWNPGVVVSANMDKAYLRLLEEQGIEVPATAWLDRGTRVALADLLQDRGWRQAVVKPSISASAHRTWVATLADADALQGRLDELLADGNALVQEFAPEVTDAGEWSLVFLRGHFSHAVLKLPAAGDFRVQAEQGGSARLAPAPAALVEQARSILDRIDAPWLYARVDGVERGGRFLLMELELVEPELFLRLEPAAAGRFADAILAAD